MAPASIFLAYPSQPKAIRAANQAGAEFMRDTLGIHNVRSWEENDIAGSFIRTSVLEEIRSADLLVADITKLNFNVTYEIGYAIGLGKRAYLLTNSALESDAKLIADVGIFDTLGYESYSTAAQFGHQIQRADSAHVLVFDAESINRKAPVYLLWPQNRTDYETHVLSRVNKAGLQFRSFDPDETGRLSAAVAIDNVASSLGIIVPFVSLNRNDAIVQNLRGAFIAGLAAGMDKACLLLQPGYEPVPLDYRDFVDEFTSPSQISEFVGEFAASITDKLQRGIEPPISEPRNFLAQLSLGSSIAENERDLNRYYVETDEYQRALNGDVQLVVGRKGSGKTALFIRLRDLLRQRQTRIVLDLQPQGYQLLKFRSQVLDLLEVGTKEHTITAFWEYLLLLEICHKILHKDKVAHTRNHDLYEPYRRLEAAYDEDPFVLEGDFAERMLQMIDAISDGFQSKLRSKTSGVRLNNAEITELLYKHDVAPLRNAIYEYLAYKEGMWVLFDNLDKGWPATGIAAADAIIVRALLDAFSKMKRAVVKVGIECNGIVFLRNDVFDLLIEATPDRGKISHATIDWTDPERMREMLRRRFVFAGASDEASFIDIWQQICITHYKGEESSQYLIDRSLMRPRCLIDLVNYCRSEAVNFLKDKIEAEDIKEGEGKYSSDLVHSVNFEIRDVVSNAPDLLYIFIGSPKRIDSVTLTTLVGKNGIADPERIRELLIWFGVLGLVRQTGLVSYVYDVQYDLKRFLALIHATPSGNPVFEINPAFWKGLEIDQS